MRCVPVILYYIVKMPQQNYGGFLPDIDYLLFDLPGGSLQGRCFNSTAAVVSGVFMPTEPIKISVLNS